MIGKLGLGAKPSDRWAFENRDAEPKHLILRLYKKYNHTLIKERKKFEKEIFSIDREFVNAQK